MVLSQNLEFFHKNITSIYLNTDIEYSLYKSHEKLMSQAGAIHTIHINKSIT